MALGVHKASRYNFFYPNEDGRNVIAYNSLTNSVVELKNTAYEAIKPKLAAGELEIDGIPLLEGLAKQGFLVPADFDELAAIKAQRRKDHSNAAILGLTIQPTLSCNFRCDYCFQEHPKAFMNKEVEHGLLKFVEQHTPDLKYLGVTWFGGEPLLAMPTIGRLSEAFMEMGERLGFKYAPARLVTNGWGLTESNCLLLRNWSIGAIQITIDGIGSAHDARRPLTNGGPTFDRILENLQTVRRVMPDTSLTVRVNVDAANPAALQDTRAFFAEQGLSDVTVAVGHVTEYTEHSWVREGVVSAERLYQIANRSDSTSLACGTSSLITFPTIKGGAFCGAQKENVFVVSPTGALFKCWIEGGMDESRAVGHVLRTGSPRSESEQHFAALYEQWDQTDDPDCAECKVLPICGGGCLWKGMTAQRDMTRAAKDCSPYKFGDTLERSVRLKTKPKPQDSSPSHPQLKQQEKKDKENDEQLRINPQAR